MFPIISIYFLKKQNKYEHYNRPSIKSLGFVLKRKVWRVAGASFVAAVIYMPCPIMLGTTAFAQHKRHSSPTQIYVLRNNSVKWGLCANYLLRLSYVDLVGMGYVNTVRQECEYA